VSKRLALLVCLLAALHGRSAAAPSTKKQSPPQKTVGTASKKPAPSRSTAETAHAKKPTVPKPADVRPERSAKTDPAAHPSVEVRIVAARAAFQAGHYAEVPTTLVKLLSESQCSPPQLAAIYELLASAYVALGQPELAVHCFTELLTRRPAFTLDPIRTSPKIRAALDEARLHSVGRRAM
jgi:hypothetical protein